MKKIVVLLLIPFLSFINIDNIQKIQVEMTTRTLEKGQYVTIKSSIFIDILKEQMITHTAKPFEQVAFNNASGEMKVYNVQYNTLSITNDISLSSRNSFFYNFLYGSTGDLGLKKAGFKITQTKTEEKTITVTTWEPIVKMAKGTQKIILAHENNLPIFMSFIDEKKLTFLKIYYDNYQKLNNLFLPTLMTEIEYTSKKDSVITRRNFADFKTNETCDKTYFNFVIPSSAKLIQTGSK
jgi:hypothetical protein